MHSRETLNEFNIMRSFAILIVLYHHLPSYSMNYYDLNFLGVPCDLSFINDLNRYFALGIFVFISGYLQEYNYMERGIKSYVSRKIFRIIPLYLLALVLFVVMIGSVNLNCFVIHSFGLQILVASSFCQPLPTLWYVGLIIGYYLLFIVIKKMSNERGINIVLLYLGFFVLAILIKVLTGAIDKRFFIYYFIFVMGVLVARMDIYKYLYTRTFILSLIILVVSLYLYASDIYPLVRAEMHVPFFSYSSFEAFGLVNLIMVSWVVLVYYICSISRMKSRLINIVAYSSYCIYLFHRPVWWGMVTIYNPSDDILRGAYLGVLGLPIIIFISYYAQKKYDDVYTRLAFK